MFGTCESLLQPNIEDVLETLQILAKAHGLPVPEGPAAADMHVPQQHALARVEEALRSGGLCDACGADTRMPLVAPCAHLLCVWTVLRSAVRRAACARRSISSRP